MEIMDDDELFDLAQKELELSESLSNSTLSGDRLRALNYAYGDMADTPAATGRSKAMTRTVRDTIGWIMPSVMRVFFASDEIAAVVPMGPEDEDRALQQQDGLNYVFTKDCSGYQVLSSAWHDSMLLRNGVVKFWWAFEKKRTYNQITGIDDDALAVLMADNQDLQIAEKRSYQKQVDAGLNEGQPFTQETVTLHDVKFYREKNCGKPMMEAVPPENFRINSEARSSEDARFMAHVDTVMRGDLIKDGHDRETVWGLKSATVFDNFGMRAEREKYTYNQAPVTGESGVRATDLVQIAECYVLADRDGDGIPEWVQVIMGGGGSGWVGLSAKPWTDPVPFVDFVSEAVPHRREGISIFDQTADLQQISTVVLRSALDNIYAQGNPQKAVNENLIENMDAVLSPQFNGVIRVKGEPQSAVFPITHPFIAGDLFQTLEALNGMVEMRTGVSRSTMALDPKALSNVTATTTNAAVSASYSKIEQIARNFADRLVILLRGLNQLLVTHQDQQRTIRARGKWVSLDPRSWNADADIIVSPAISFGNREREMMMLQMVLQLQKEIVANYGPDNPVVPPSKILNTAAQLVRAAGLRNADMYFNDVPDAQLLPMIQQMKAAQKNPLIEKAEIEAKADAGKAQLKAQTDIQVNREKTQANMALRQQEMQMEAGLDALKIATQGSKDTNIARPQ